MIAKIPVNKLVKGKYYFQGFNGTPGLLTFGPPSALKYMFKHLGYGYDVLIDLYEGDKCYYAYEWKSLYNLLDNLMRRVKKNKGYLKRLDKKHQALNRRHLALLRRLDKSYLFSTKRSPRGNTRIPLNSERTTARAETRSVLNKYDKSSLKKISTEKLIENYQQLAESLGELLGVSHVVEGFSLTCEEKIRRLLRCHLNKVGKKEKFNEIIAELTMPIFASFIGEAHNEILEVGIKFSNGKNIANDLKRLEKSYYWLNNGYSKTEHLGKEYFLGEIKHSIKKGYLFSTKRSPRGGTRIPLNSERTTARAETRSVLNKYKKGINEKEVKNYKKSFVENKKRKLKLFKELKLPKELVLLLNISDFMAQLQDNRKHYITITLAYLDDYLKEIGKRFNIEHENMRYLVQPEVAIENLRKITKQQFAARRKRCIFFATKESMKMNPMKRFVMFTGKKAEQLIDALDVHKHEKVTELKGNCASSGHVKGRVKVCRGADQLSKVKQGDILVACMTQPEFVPAMKRAAAVVTDEGGLTCHAAIVSRELGIPCVIGTKIATKVLKDGMLVEVDAENGVVRILK